MKNYLFIAILLTFIASCDSAKTKKEPVCHIDLTNLPDMKTEKIKLTDWAHKTRFIPLETNDSILIKSIRKIILHEDKLLVFHPNRASVFDLSGHYLYDIGRMGQGPKEFSRLLDIVSANDLLYIRDLSSQIKIYDWNGVFIKNMNIPKMDIANYYPLPGSDVIAGHIPNLSGTKKDKLVFFRDTTVVARIENYETYPSPKVFVFFDNEMKMVNGKPNTFKEMFNDTVFTITSDYKLKPYAVVDLGAYALPADFLYTLTPEKLQKNIFKGKINLAITAEKDDVLYMHYNYNKETYTVYYDKKEGKAHRVSLVYPDNSYEIAENKYFVPQFFSDNHQYLINFEELDNEENPVVILVER